MTLNNDVRALTAKMSHYVCSLLTTELELMTCNEPCLVTSTLSALLGQRLIGIGRHFYTTQHSHLTLTSPHPHLTSPVTSLLYQHSPDGQEKKHPLQDVHPLEKSFYKRKGIIYVSFYHDSYKNLVIHVDTLALASQTK